MTQRFTQRIRVAVVQLNVVRTVRHGIEPESLTDDEADCLCLCFFDRFGCYGFAFALMQSFMSQFVCDRLELLSIGQRLVNHDLATNRVAMCTVELLELQFDSAVHNNTLDSFQVCPDFTSHL